MTRSATDLMQDIVFSAVIDSVMALKAASKGLPNTLLRDLNAVHANTTFSDLPAEVQTAIAASVRAAFTRLLKEGYSVSPAGSAPQPRRDGPPGPRGPGRGGPRREGEGRRPAGDGPRDRSGPNRDLRGGRPPRGGGGGTGGDGARPGGGRPRGGRGRGKPGGG